MTDDRMGTARRLHVGRLGPLLRSAGVVGTAMAATNVLTYAFVLLAARVLAPADFGALSSLAALLALGAAPMLALQAQVARRAALAEPAERPEGHRAGRAAGWRVALAVAVVGAAATVPLSVVLRLDALSLVLVVIALVPTTCLGAELGTLLGASAWRGFALATLGFGAARVVCGGAGLLLRPDALGAIAGVAAGAALSLAVARPLAAAASGLQRPGPSERPRRAVDRTLVRDAAHALAALLALYALTNVDVVVARIRMSDVEAGLYAAGVVLSRAAFFLPQFVTVLAFPRLASAAGARQAQRWAALAVLGVGAVVVAAAWLLPELATAFVGGDRYAAVADDLWRFAAAGALLALCHLALYARIARGDRRAVAVGWIGVVALVVAAWVVAPRGPAALATTVAVVAGCVAVVGLRAPTAEPAAGPAAG